VTEHEGNINMGQYYN